MPTTRSRIRVPRGVIVVLLIILIGAIGMVHAAQLDYDSRQQTGQAQAYPDPAVGPAHPLYGLKLSLENLDESFAATPKDRIGRQVDHAGNRIAEVRTGLANDQESAARMALEEYRVKMDATGKAAAALPRHQAQLADTQDAIHDQQTELEDLLSTHEEDTAIRDAYIECIRIKTLITDAAVSQSATQAPATAITPQLKPSGTKTPRPSPTFTATPSPAFTQTPVSTTVSPTQTATPSPTATDAPAPAKTTVTPTPTQTHTTPVVSGSAGSSTISLSWPVITDTDLQGYKVVVSKSSHNPKYPDDGYMYWITDRRHNYATLDSSSSYTGGDIGGTLQPGQAYYISVTAVYPDAKVPGNSLTMIFPGPKATTAAPTQTATPATPTPTATTLTGTPTPTATATTVPPHTVPSSSASVSGKTIAMNWQKIPDSDFIGYKVVISRSRDNPAYPGDGYMFWITDRDTTSATITDTDNYQGGDIGGTLKPGTSYAFSITAIYQPWTTVAGNSVRLTFPEPATPTPTATTATPTTNATPSAASPAPYSACDFPSCPNPLLLNGEVPAVM